MVALVRGLRLGGERLVVPRQPACISSLWRDKVKQGDRPGCGWGKRRDDSVTRGAKGVQKCRPHRLSALFTQAAQEQHRCADASDRTKPPRGGTQVPGVAEQMAPESKRIVAC